MQVDKQRELMSDLLLPVHQHGGDDVTWKPQFAQPSNSFYKFSANLNIAQGYLTVIY